MFDLTFNNMGGDVTQNDYFQVKKTALEGTHMFQTKCMGGDLDEMIDFQRIKSRDL